MKIVVVSPFFPPAWEWGGKAKAAWTLAQALAEAKVEVVVLATDAKPKGRVRVPAIRVEAGVTVKTAPVLGWGVSRGANRQGIAPGLLGQLIEEIPGCDLVHIQGIWGFLTPGICKICAFRKIPYIISTRNELGFWSLSRKRLKKQIFLNLVIKRDIQRAARIHFTSRKEMDEAPPWLNRDRLFIVPNPVTVMHEGAGERFRSRYELRDDEMVFGLVGRLHKEKGFDIILPAMAGLSPRQKFRFLIIGPDENGYLNEIHRLVRQLGIPEKVLIVGPLYGQELADAYAGMDLLVVPSYDESFGNVVVEAVGQGTPVFVSEKVGLADWVLEKKVGRVLPLDHHPWIDGLTNTDRASISRDWIRDELKQTARQSFSKSTVAAKMIACYEEVIARGKSR